MRQSIYFAAIGSIIAITSAFPTPQDQNVSTHISNYVSIQSNNNGTVTLCKGTSQKTAKCETRSESSLDNGPGDIPDVPEIPDIPDINIPEIDGPGDFNEPGFNAPTNGTRSGVNKPTLPPSGGDNSFGNDGANGSVNVDIHGNGDGTVTYCKNGNCKVVPSGVNVDGNTIEDRGKN